jgi:hypothetical protein
MLVWFAGARSPFKAHPSPLPVRVVTAASFFLFFSHLSFASTKLVRKQSRIDPVQLQAHIYI